VRVMSATSHEAPYVLDGLLHHGTSLRIGTHYVDTGGASDHVLDDGKDSCGILTQRPLTRGLGFADEHRQAGRTAAARAAC
jgi:hypothetical protein